MQILGKSPNIWMNKMVNFNGIYKINAEVKEIVQIEDGNCILWTTALTNWFYFTFILFTLLSKQLIKNKNPEVNQSICQKYNQSTNQSNQW